MYHSIGFFDIGFSNLLVLPDRIPVREIRAVWIATRDYKIVGGALEALRKSAGVTQQELAKRLRKPQSFVSSYEGGQRRVDLLELVRITKALNGDPYVICRQILDQLVGTRR